MNYEENNMDFSALEHTHMLLSTSQGKVLSCTLVLKVISYILKLAEAKPNFLYVIK